MSEKPNNNQTLSAEDFKEAQANLLHYYAQQQSAQGPRLIGFSIGLFTLFQLVLTSQKVSQLLPNLIFPSVFTPLGNDVFKLLFLLIASSIIMYFILRTVFRYCLYGYLPSGIMCTCRKDAEDTITEYNNQYMKDNNGRSYEYSALFAVNTSAFRLIHCKWLYGLFHAYWFYSIKDPNPQYKSNQRVGAIILAILAFIISCLLITFFW